MTLSSRRSAVPRRGPRSASGGRRKTGAARAAFVLALACLASDADAFELKRTSTGEPLRWRKPHVVWEIDPSFDVIVQGRTAAEHAARSWSGVERGPQIDVKSARSAGAPAYDGQNGIYVVDELPTEAQASSHALAVTILKYDDDTGAILDADILVNGAFSFAVLEEPRSLLPERTAPVYDIGWVVAHEMGHALGLADEPENSDATMYPYVGGGGPLRSGPRLDDADGMRALYLDEAEVAAVPASGCMVTKETQPRSWLAVVVTTAIGLAGASRRRRSFKDR